MLHFLFWVTMIGAAILVAWAMRGNGSFALWEGHLSVDIILWLLGANLVAQRTISIWQYFFGR